MNADFERLTPDDFIPALENSLSASLNGFASALPSYINRVYELEAQSGDRLVVKFYRPGRWTSDAILDEHDFMWDCDDAEIPVVPPFELSSGSTLDFYEGIPYALFPKKRGRLANLESPEAFSRIGALLGRMHACGAMRDAPARMRMTPGDFAFAAMDRLFRSGAVHPAVEEDLMHLCEEILDIAEDYYPDPSTFFRIHGDFHRGNVLERPDEGLMAIDFDDMLIGPALQDFWLLLPGTREESAAELSALLHSYRMFMDFDESQLSLIEVFRAMRMMHFLSWCAFQSSDFRFRELYPDWGSESFWRSELADFSVQRERILREFGC